MIQNKAFFNKLRAQKGSDDLGREAVLGHPVYSNLNTADCEFLTKHNDRNDPANCDDFMYRRILSLRVDSIVSAEE